MLMETLQMLQGSLHLPSHLSVVRYDLYVPARDLRLAASLFSVHLDPELLQARKIKQYVASFSEL